MGEEEVGAEPVLRHMAKKKLEEGAEATAPAEETVSRFDNLMSSELFAKIKKQHGKNILTSAHTTQEQRVQRIPTGIYQLDYALGGGWPVGRVNIAYGPKSAGKTSNFLRAIANAQNLCANCYQMDLETGEPCTCGTFRESVCAFLDVEGTFDLDWAQKLRVDTKRLLLSKPDYAEQTLDIAEALVRSQEVDIIVIDSLAFLTPAKEIEESVGKELQAQQARTLGRGIRKFVAAINHVGNKTGRRPTMLFTNQIRMKVGVMFGNPETQPGGFASGFAATTEVRCSGGTYEMDETTGRPLWVDLKYKIDKNKSSGAKMEGEYRVMLSDSEHKKMGDVVDEPFMLDMGMKMSMVEKDGNGWLALGEKYRSKEVLLNRLTEDRPFKATFGRALLTLLTA